MSAQPPTTAAPAAPMVAVPVKSSWSSKEAWLFCISGILFVLSVFFDSLPAAFIASHAWIPAVMQGIGAASSAVGFLIRLMKPDLVTGVPWLDKANALAPRVSASMEK